MPAPRADPCASWTRPAPVRRIMRGRAPALPASKEFSPDRMNGPWSAPLRPELYQGGIATGLRPNFAAEPARGPAQFTVTVTRRKVAGIDVALLFAAVFWASNKAFSSWSNWPALPFFSAA